MDQPPAILTLDHFLPLVGQAFPVAGLPDAPPFSLVEVKPMDAHDYSGRQRDPFSLVFRASSAAGPEQGLRRLCNAALGEVDIFLVPVGADADGTLYEAVFN